MLFLPREEAQGLLEYGMAIVLVAVVIALVVILLGPEIGDLFSTVVNMWPS